MGRSHATRSVRRKEQQRGAGADLKILSKLLREGGDGGAKNVGAEESDEEGKVFSFGLFYHSVTLVYLAIN